MADAKKTDPNVEAMRGPGGELHQTASAPEPRITTNHGVPIER